MKTALDVLSGLTELLEKDFPVEAYKEITFEDGSKGMGLIAQYATDRLNEVFGLGGWSMPNEIEYIYAPHRGDGIGASGEIVEVICTGHIEIHSGALNFSTVECDGGGKLGAHQSVADARKSAKTQLKSKCCSYLGIGSKAYRGQVVLVADEPKKDDYELKDQPNIIDGERPVDYEMAPTIPAKDEIADDQETVVPIFNGETAAKALWKADHEAKYAEAEAASHPVHTESDQKKILEFIESTHGLTKDDIMIISGRSRVKVSFLKEFYTCIEAHEQFPGSEFELNYDHFPKVSFGEIMSADPSSDTEPKEEEDAISKDESDAEIIKLVIGEPSEKPELENHTTGSASFEPMTEKRNAMEVSEVYDALKEVWGKPDEDDEELDDLMAELDEMDAKFPEYINPGSVSTTLTKIARIAPQAMIDRLLVVSKA